MKKKIKLTENQLHSLIKRMVQEADSDDEKYEKGKSGMRAARSRADYEPTPKEADIVGTLFGKYGDDVPPIVVRYLRKMGKKQLTKRLCDLNMIDVDTVMDELGGDE
jgi:hypothetical protein